MFVYDNIESFLYNKGQMGILISHLTLDKTSCKDRQVTLYRLANYHIHGGTS